MFTIYRILLCCNIILLNSCSSIECKPKVINYKIILSTTSNEQNYSVTIGNSVFLLNSLTLGTECKFF